MNIHQIHNVPVPGSVSKRSSLACIPCRSRHLKCDGQRPCCRRCIESAKNCYYVKSRRGGLDREARIERRKRLAAADDCLPAGNLRSQDRGIVQQEQGPLMPIPRAHVYNIEDDSLVESYYKSLHNFHPFVLPRRHLTKLYLDSDMQSRLSPLISVLRFAGHLYDSQEWSTTQQSIMETCLSEASQIDPIMVQCRLLYSIVLFWHGYTAKSKVEMDTAVRLALDLQMFRCEFAADHGCGDPVLMESWRRTWWMLYIVDAYYAGTLGSMKSACMDIEATVELPCEEAEYESGELPKPKTLQDFDCREFSLDNTSFSSFAYLIGATRCVVSTLSTAVNTESKEASIQVIHTVDSAIDGWLLLLPKDCKQVMDKSGKIDELLFQAHLLVHVATIGVHRPLSDLKFNAIEDVSSCARKPPPNLPTREFVNVHTVRVLRSVEAQVRLLALPAQHFKHTPFTTCMVSEGTLALLSACKFLLKGEDLAIARHQIRLTIGCLRELGEIWPRTARNLREIQTIAGHALGLSESNSSIPSVNDLPDLSCGHEQPTAVSEAGESSNDVFPAVSLMDGICGWYSAGDLDLGPAWWSNE